MHRAIFVSRFLAAKLVHLICPPRASTRSNKVSNVLRCVCFVFCRRVHLQAKLDRRGLAVYFASFPMQYGEIAIKRRCDAELRNAIRSHTYCGTRRYDKKWRGSHLTRSNYDCNVLNHDSSETDTYHSRRAMVCHIAC